MYNPNNSNEELEKFEKFQLYGYFGGGVLPVGVFLIFSYFYNINHDISNPLKFNSIAWIGFTIALGIGWLASRIGRKTSLTGKKFNTAFTFQAIYSFVFIHGLVLYTGGPMTSLFSSAYLYIPTAIGYIFQRGSRLNTAMFVLTISYLVNFFYSDWQKQKISEIIKLWPKITINRPINLQNVEVSPYVYMIIFGLQLRAIWIMSKKKNY